MHHYYKISTTSNVLALSYEKDWMQHVEMKALINEVKKHLSSFQDEPWALYEDLRNWPIKVPDHIDTCASVTQELMQQGMTHCGVCTGGVAVSEWMMKKILPEKVQISFCESPEETLNWLENKGFDVAQLRDVVCINR